MMVVERGFEGLDFYRESLVLVRAAYRLAEGLPDHERYNLSDQLRRAACSVPLNIAEGYGRYHYLDRLRFLYIARGSLFETLSAFVIAANLGYCQDEQLTWARACFKKIEKGLNGYIRFQRNQQQGSNEYGTQAIADPPTPYTAPHSPIPLSPTPDPLSPILPTNHD